MQMSIHLDLRLLFRQHRLQASLLMMEQQTLMKSLTNAGRISLTVARRAVSCVPPDLVPPRLHVPRNGSFHKVPRPESTPYMFASLPCAQQQKAPSIRFVTPTKMIKWWSIRRSFRIHFMSQMDGSILASTISQGPEMNTSS